VARDAPVYLRELIGELGVLDAPPCLDDNAQELLEAHAALGHGAGAVPLENARQRGLVVGQTDAADGALELLDIKRLRAEPVLLREDLPRALLTVGALLLVQLTPRLLRGPLEAGVLQGQHAELLEAVEAQLGHVEVGRDGELEASVRGPA